MKLNFVRSVSLLSIFYFGVLIAPILVILLQVPSIEMGSIKGIWPMLKFSFYQASLAATLVMFFSSFSALSLVNASDKKWSYWQPLLLLPSFLPTIVVVFSVVNFWERFSQFPFGLKGIVVLHCIILLGISIVSMRQNILVASESALRLLTVSAPTFINLWWHGFFMPTRRLLLRQWILYFGICWGSFSVPFLAGDGFGQTVETLIYQWIKIDLNWPGAAGMAILQVMILFLLSLAVDEKFTLPTRYKFWEFHELNKKFSIFKSLPILAFLFAVVGNFSLIKGGFKLILADRVLLKKIFSATYLTIQIALWSMGISFFLLIAMLYLIRKSKCLKKFIQSYFAPSTAVMGFGVLLLSLIFGGQRELWLGFGLSLSVVGFLYRWRLEAVDRSLDRQEKFAYVNGVGPVRSFLLIVIPQMWLPLFSCLGLVSIWTLGDFAYSKILLQGSKTIGLLVAEFLGGYRLDVANAAVCILLIFALVQFLVILGVGVVTDRKFKSHL